MPLRPATHAALAACLAAGPALAEPLEIVVLGDAPYGEPAEVYPPFEALIETINAAAPDIVIHVGDTKSGSTPCSDEMLAEQLAFLGSFSAPVIYTPGDNEWTDCHREAAGGFDPVERLARIRATYFDAPGTSFGQAPAELAHQGEAGHPENVILTMGDVTFVAAHVVGSNNNFEVRDMAAVEEFMARDAANLDWLGAGFAAAREAGSAAVVVAIHADMFGPEFGSGSDPEGWPRHSGFANFGPALIEEAAAFGGPVLLVYGDAHRFRQSRPFPEGAPNLLALEVPGAEDMHAVRVTADPDAAGAFSAELLRNPALPG